MHVQSAWVLSLADHTRKRPDLGSSPPRPGLPFRREVAEPILPQHRPNECRPLARERVAFEQAQHGWASLDEPLLRLLDPWRLLPWAERREPEVPLEARLIRGIDAGMRAWVLWLVPERIGDPEHSVEAPLKLDLVPGFGHDGEEAVGVRDAERIQHAERPRPGRERALHEERDDGRAQQIP